MMPPCNFFMSAGINFCPITFLNDCFMLFVLMNQMWFVQMADLVICSLKSYGIHHRGSWPRKGFYQTRTSTPALNYNSSCMAVVHLPLPLTFSCLFWPMVGPAVCFFVSYVICLMVTVSYAIRCLTQLFCAMGCIING